MILTAENYFSAEASREFMSVSQYKSFGKCEAAAMAEIRGEYVRPKTTALLVGSYVDAHFEGTLDVFKAQNPEIFTQKGELRADYRQAEEIIERCERDELFMEYMSGTKQEIFTGELFGATWKIKIDSLLPDKIVDLKCMRSLERIMGVSFVEHWQYDAQGAIYQAIYSLASDKTLPFFIAVATKGAVTDLEIIHIPQWRLDECLQEAEKQMPRILAVKSGEILPERCGVCDYCKATKVLTGPIEMDDVGFSTKELKSMRGEF